MFFPWNPENFVLYLIYINTTYSANLFTYNQQFFSFLNSYPATRFLSKEGHERQKKMLEEIIYLFIFAYMGIVCIIL